MSRNHNALISWRTAGVAAAGIGIFVMVARGSSIKSPDNSAGSPSNPAASGIDVNRRSALLTELGRKGFQPVPGTYEDGTGSHNGLRGFLVYPAGSNALAIDAYDTGNRITHCDPTDTTCKVGDPDFRLAQEGAGGAAVCPGEASPNASESCVTKATGGQALGRVAPAVAMVAFGRPGSPASYVSLSAA